MHEILPYSTSSTPYQEDAAVFDTRGKLLLLRNLGFYGNISGFYGFLLGIFRDFFFEKRTGFFRSYLPFD